MNENFGKAVNIDSFKEKCIKTELKSPKSVFGTGINVGDSFYKVATATLQPVEDTIMVSYNIVLESELERFLNEYQLVSFDTSDLDEIIGTFTNDDATIEAIKEQMDEQMEALIGLNDSDVLCDRSDCTSENCECNSGLRFVDADQVELMYDEAPAEMPAEIYKGEEKNG